MSPPFLNGVERGKPTAQIGRVLQVCHALGIRLLALPPEIVDLKRTPRRKPGSGSGR